MTDLSDFIKCVPIIFNICNISVSTSASTPPDQEDSGDSCIDITSPTPSQSTSESSSGSSQSSETKKVSGERPPPVGCSASGTSEEEGNWVLRL